MSQHHRAALKLCSTVADLNHGQVRRLHAAHDHDDREHDGIDEQLDDRKYNRQHYGFNHSLDDRQHYWIHDGQHHGIDNSQHHGFHDGFYYSLDDRQHDRIDHGQYDRIDDRVDYDHNDGIHDRFLNFRWMYRELRFHMERGGVGPDIVCQL